MKRLNESDIEVRISQLEEAVTLLEAAAKILGQEDERRAKKAVMEMAGALLARTEEIADEAEAEAEAQLERGGE